MDEADLKLTDELKRDGRISNLALAKKLKVSEGTVRNRLKRLFDEGIIRRFSVELSLKGGFGAIVLLQTAPEKPTAEIVKSLKKLEGIDRIYEVSGDWDVVLETISASAEDFNDLIEKIRALKGVQSTRTLVVLQRS